MTFNILLVVFIASLPCSVVSQSCFPGNRWINCLLNTCTIYKTCPGDPAATCQMKRTECGCDANWYKASGEKADCDPRHNLKLCPGGERVVRCDVDSCSWPCSHPDFLSAPCKQTRCGKCKAEYFVNEKWVTCPTGDKRKSDQVQVPPGRSGALSVPSPVSCSYVPCSIHICINEKCPLEPHAVCRPDGCNECKPAWLLNDAPVQCHNQVNPLVPSKSLIGVGNQVCEAGQQRMPCDQTVCDRRICRNYPEAVCRPDGCGECKATWFVGAKQVDCLNEECPSNVPFVRCIDDPCKHFSHYCPDAICRASQCGTCEAKFYANGVEIDCAMSPKVCPASVKPRNCKWFTCPSNICPSNKRLMCRIDPCGPTCRHDWINIYNGEILTCRTFDGDGRTIKHQSDKVYHQDPLAPFSGGRSTLNDQRSDIYPEPQHPLSVITGNADQALPETKHQVDIVVSGGPGRFRVEPIFVKPRQVLSEADLYSLLTAYEYELMGVSSLSIQNALKHANVLKAPFPLPSVPLSPAAPSGDRNNFLVPSSGHVSLIAPPSQRISPFEPSGDHMGPLAPSGDRIGPLAPSGDHMSLLAPSGDRMGPLAPFGDHISPTSPAGDRMSSSVPRVDHLKRDTVAGEPATPATGARGLALPGIVRLGIKKPSADKGIPMDVKDGMQPLSETDSVLNTADPSLLTDANLPPESEPAVTSIQTPSSSGIDEPFLHETLALQKNMVIDSAMQRTKVAKSEIFNPLANQDTPVYPALVSSFSPDMINVQPGLVDQTKQLVKVSSTFGQVGNAQTTADRATNLNQGLDKSGAVTQELSGSGTIPAFSIKSGINHQLRDGPGTLSAMADQSVTTNNAVNGGGSFNPGVDQFSTTNPGVDQFGATNQDVYQFSTTNQGVDQFGATNQGVDQFGSPNQNIDQFGATHQGVDQFGATNQGVDQFSATNQGVDQFGATHQGVDQFGSSLGRHIQVEQQSRTLYPDLGPFGMKSQTMAIADPFQTSLLSPDTLISNVEQPVKVVPEAVVTGWSGQISGVGQNVLVQTALSDPKKKLSHSQPLEPNNVSPEANKGVPISMGMFQTWGGVN